MFKFIVLLFCCNLVTDCKGWWNSQHQGLETGILLFLSTASPVNHELNPLTECNCTYHCLGPPTKFWVSPFQTIVIINKGVEQQSCTVSSFRSNAKYFWSDNKELYDEGRGGGFGGLRV